MGRVRQAWRWTLLLLAVAVCAGAGYGAYTLAGYSWDKVVSYASPYTGMKLPAAAPGRGAPASRVIIVVVDGLRNDVSRQMTGVQSLRGYGADWVLRTGQPSLSYPGWTMLVSGAPQNVSGVTTNWFKGPVKVETLFDTALRAGKRVVVVGPPDLQELYDTDRAAGVSYREWDHQYLSAKLVDDAIALTKEKKAEFVFVLLPDVDEAGHESGGASAEYLAMAQRVDADVRRLVEAFQNDDTLFVVVADHGHIDSGGHGGWEPDVVNVPAVFAGAGVALGQGEGRQEDFAPTIAALTGIPSPRFAEGEAIQGVMADRAPALLKPTWDQRSGFAGKYAFTARGPANAPPGAPLPPGAHGEALDSMIAANEHARLAFDRRDRLLIALAAAAACAAVIWAVGMASWRALVAALAGTAAYFGVYNSAYFLLHGFRWSLSAFNSEDKVQAFFYGRMAEAAVSLLLAAVVAGLVYPRLRSVPRPARGEFVPGWLTLGPATALVILAALGLQVVWYYWAWGIAPTWSMPDLLWGFKYDLDLIQATAVGFAAIVTPLVTFTVGRYHPRVRRGGSPKVSTARISPSGPETSSASPTTPE